MLYFYSLFGLGSDDSIEFWVDCLAVSAGFIVGLATHHAIKDGYTRFVNRGAAVEVEQ